MKGIVAVSAEEIKAPILRMYALGNQEHVDQTEAFLSLSFVVRDVDKPDVQGNYEDHQHFLTWFDTTFSGKTTIEDITAEGDTVVLSTTFHGIQKGEQNGRLPGQEVSFMGMTTYRITEGKTVEQWHKHLTQQLHTEEALVREIAQKEAISYTVSEAGLASYVLRFSSVVLLFEVQTNF